MKTIPIAEIVIASDRQRQKYSQDAASDLITTIGAPEVGLLSPVILRVDAEGKFHLVAGGRRCKAVTLLHKLGRSVFHMDELIPVGEIAYLTFAELSPLRQQEIEYAENAYRENLTWQENVEATERLHALRVAQQAAAPQGTVPPHSISDTAEEIFGRSDGGFRDTVRSSLVVAKHMSNPAVAKASSLKEATKVIRRIEETARHEHLAAMVGGVSLSERYKIYNTEALVWMEKQPGGQFDVILTDPPYGMNADSFGDAAWRMAGIGHDYSDGAEPTRDLLSKCIPEWYRLAKEQAHLYLWCDIDLFLELREMCRQAGWWTFRSIQVMNLG